MAKTTNSAISRTLAKILKNVDTLPNLDDGFDGYWCRATAKHGGRCRNRSCWPNEELQTRSLWSKFRIMTECPDTDDFYDQMETFIAFTHCKRHHRGIALDAFAVWKAKRQAASNSPPLTSSPNEISKNKQHDNSPEILHDSTSVKSLDSISAEDEAEELQSISSDSDESTGNENINELVERVASDNELILQIKEAARHWTELNEQGKLRLSRSKEEIKALATSYEEATASLEEAAGFGGPEYAWKSTNGDFSFLSEADLRPSITAKTGNSSADKASGNSFDMTQDIQANIIAPPATDSGYGSTSATESKFGMSMRHADIEQPTQEISDQDMNDTATEYSEESRSTFSKKQGFVRELANELFKAISSLNANEMIQARVSNILPELLQAFALKVGYGAKTQMHRDVMAFVYRYRR